MALKKSDLYSSLWASCDELRGGIAADGWVRGVQPREIIRVKDKNKKLVWPEPHDYLKGKRRFKSDLVPAPILVARYFIAERDAIEEFDNQLATLEQQLDEMRQENSGEDGLLAEVIEGEGDKQKIAPKAEARLKEIGKDSLYSAERASLEAYAGLLKQQTEAKGQGQAQVRARGLGPKDRRQEALAVYSSDELDTDPGNGGDNNVYLKDWLEEGKKKLDETREALRYLCEPVALPREVEQFLHYFCGDAANPNALNETEALRMSFYKAVAVFVRAYAAIAQDLTEAGYSDAAALQQEVEFYGEIRSAIKKHSGEELDIKPYEADMRHLLNTYIQADPAADLGELGEMSLTELIIETGIHDAIARKLNEKGTLSKNAIAEGIINKRAEPPRRTHDYGRRRVSVAGSEVPLTATEFDLLRTLSINAGRVMTTEALLRQVWGRRGSDDTDRVRTVVKKLRAKLGDNAASPTYIFTEHGVGYRMVSPGRA